MDRLTLNRDHLPVLAGGLIDRLDDAHVLKAHLHHLPLLESHP